MRHWLREHGWLLGVLAVASFAMLFRLGAQPIQNWDEGIHGTVSLEMMEDGDWLTPHYMGGTYFRKPPLKIWMTAALFKLLPTPFAEFQIANFKLPAIAWMLRLPSALAGIAMSLLVAWWMWEWRRSRLEAFLAGAIVATMRPIFFHAFRTGEMDGLLTLFTTAALYSWWKAVERPSSTHSPSHREGEKKRGWWLATCGAAIGLAVITKSAAGLLPIPIIMAHALFTGTWRRIRIRDVLVLALVLVAITAPWHLTMIAIHGSVFWNDYFGWHIVKRVTEVLHNPTAGVWWWYFPTLARRFTPYTYWFIPAIAYAIAGMKNRKTEELKNYIEAHMMRLLLIWFLVGFALFTIARTKFDWYLLPLYPATIMLTVAFLTTARKVTTDRLAAAGHLAAIAAFTFFLPAMFPATTITDRIIERWYALFGGPIVLAAIVVAAALSIVVVVHRRWGATIAGRIAHVIVIIIVMVPGLTVTARHLRARTPAGPFPAIVETIRGSKGVLVSYGMDYKQHPAGYFILRSTLHHNVRVLDGQRDTARTLSMLHERERGFLLTKNETELPEELREVTADPQLFDEFTLWRRR